MHKRNKADASTTPLKDGLPRLNRRYQAHTPETGRNESSALLVSAATPQSRPNCSHGRSPSLSSISRASEKIAASKSAARLVSHTQRVHQNITDGSSTQAQAVHTATFSLKHRLAIRKIGMQVSAEKKLWMLSKTSAAAGR